MIHNNLEVGGHFGVNHNSDAKKVLVQLQERGDEGEQVRCQFNVKETELLIKLLQKHLAAIRE